MKKRTEPTIIEKAVLTINGFKKVQLTLQQRPGAFLSGFSSNPYCRFSVPWEFGCLKR